MKTQWVPDIVDPALVCDGLVFRTHNARGRYIGTDLVKRPQYVKDNPDKCMSIEAFNEIVAARTNSGKVAATVRSDAPLSNRHAQNSVNGVSGGASELPADVSLSTERSMAGSRMPMTVASSLSAIIESEVSFKGRPCVSTPQFASVLNVSKRTLYRRFKNGKGPTRVKIAHALYDLEEALKWAADQGIAIKQAASVQTNDA
jgi:hypothetical protein